MRLLAILFATTCSLFSSDLYTLETFDRDDRYTFDHSYNNFDCLILESGEFVTVYSLLVDGDWPQYFLKKYSEIDPGISHELGVYYGMGGAGDPIVCSYSGMSVEILIRGYGDIPPYSDYQLETFDFSQNTDRWTQYHGWYDGMDMWVPKTWKIDSTQASSFIMGLEDWDSPTMLYFLSDYALFSERTWGDTTSMMVGDTLFESPVFGHKWYFSDAKLETDNIYCAFYKTEQSASIYSFICVNNDSVIAQLNSGIDGNATDIIIHTIDSTFAAIYKLPGEDELRLWSFNPYTMESIDELVLSSTEEDLEYLSKTRSTITDSNLILQIPILRDNSSYNQSNWKGLVQKRLSLNDWGIVEVDTIIQFEETTDVVHHRITNDGSNPHSIIAVRTAENSYLYYYGGSTLLYVEEENLETPKAFFLSSYPNPFNPSTTIEYDLPEQSEVSLTIYDIAGREVQKLVSTRQALGSYSVGWNGTNRDGHQVAAGMYFARLQASDHSSVVKMVYLR
ncbi:MAG: T9SS type A sorting domain-containing protein [Candidatus Marinimicrobia bacterium]|nr:T9SS type A sorting domain-containing protein [Candidatus Neomarinimicrobiota bacterium]